MLDRRKFLGVSLGFGMAAALLSRVGSASRRAFGPLNSDCDCSIKELAVQYVPESAEICAQIYRDFFRQLPSEKNVRVICPNLAAFHNLLQRVGPVSCELEPVLTGRAITCWSRDRWLASTPEAPSGHAVLLSPREEAGAAIWPARAGDQDVGDALAKSAPERIHSLRSDLFFDGGDFVADSQTVFVNPAVLRRNLQSTVQSRDELTARLARTLQRKIVLLDKSPDHHAGMYMMTAGARTVLVGDPGLAKSILANAAKTGDCCRTVADDFSIPTQELFDAVAAQCRTEGYRVVRMPVVPGANGRTFITYVNVIIDQQHGKRVVYLPIYAHTPELNTAAAEIWRGLKYEVRPVDCSNAYVHFGSLRCLVNVIRRGPAGKT